MKKLIATMTTLILIFSLSACSDGQVETVSSAENNTASDTASSNSVEAIQEASNSLVTGAASIPAALAENQAVHEDEDDYTWDSSAIIPIVLNGNSITADHPAISVDGSTVTITAAGTYSLSGSLVDGQILVNSVEQGLVRLILDGVDLHSSTSAPIYVIAADETMLVLADGTNNDVSDGAGHVLADPAENEPNAPIFSMSDLTIFGDGSLTVNGNYQDGIVSKDGLLITSGTITVTALDDGIRGKDYLVIKAGTITVEAQGDGLKSDNEEDSARGYIAIESGAFNITAGGDALHATTDVMITDGIFTLLSGGGSNSRLSEDLSAKGIKGAVSVTIDGGTFTIDTADDGIHSNGSVVVNGGTFSIASGDDGMHADATLEINGGEIQITESYEGLESAVITLNAGNIHILASDDGINVAAGNDGSGMNPAMGPGGKPGRGPGQDAFAAYSGNYYLYIHGGYVVIEAAGDGIDVNGAIEMTGGVVLVSGPTENMNGALDHDGGFTMTGGFLVAAGSAGMAQAPGTGSSQYSILLNLNNAARAGILFHIQDSAGEDILTFAPTRQYQSVVFSSPALKIGTTYTVYVGGSSTGTVTDGLYQGGVYTPGEEYTSLKISSIVTQIGGGRTRP